MKKIIYLICNLILLIAQTQASNDLIPLKIGVYENPPKIFTDENGAVSGFWADIVNYIARNEDWDIEWVSGTWEQCLERLENNEIDIMVDVAFNAERAEKFIFQKETTLMSWSRLYTSKGIALQSIFDLEGKSVAGLKGSYNLEGSEGFIDMLRKFKVNCEIIEKNDYTEVFKAIDTGEVFGGITNKDFGSRFENEYKVERTSLIFQPAELLFAFAPGSVRTPELINIIDKHIMELKKEQNSIYYKSLDKYLGGVRKEVIFPFWIRLLVSIILFLALMSFLFNWSLKYEVKQKTRELRLYIAELKKAEDELKKTRDELEIKVKHRTTELQNVNTQLQKANLRLEEASRLKSQFLANMSHELRSPLNSIIGFTGIMIQGLSGELNDEQKKQLGMVYESSRHLLGLINDILDLSKIEAGRVKINFEDMNVPELVNMVQKMISPLVEEKGLELNMEIASNIPKIICNDRNRIKQVLINLLSNSIKFTAKGRISLSCSLSETNDALLFTVNDTGIGIKEENLGSIFEEFTQVETVKNAKPEGTGLGLAISKKMIEMMGGRIWVESEFGVGTRFYFTIPLTSQSGKKAIIKDTFAPPDPDRKLILTIDDEEQSQVLLRTYLKNAGYEVIQAYNAREAMKAAVEYKPFAITLDIIMPGKDGWEIMEMLKDNPSTRDIPIICITALDNKDMGLSLGAIEYMVKPIDSELLIRELRRLEKQFYISKVLIIDDNPHDVDLMGEFLNEYKYFTLQKAYGGLEGLQKIRVEKPDLIILDLIMPDMDGFKVIRQLKKDESTKGIPIIIVSAKKLDKEEREYLNSKIEGIILKGEFNKNQLLTDIVSLIKKIEKNYIKD